MGGFIGQALLVVAAILLRDHNIIFWITIVLNVVFLFTWGLMHNSAMESAKRRRIVMVSNMRLEGRADEAERLNAQPVRTTRCLKYT